MTLDESILVEVNLPTIRTSHPGEYHSPGELWQQLENPHYQIAIKDVQLLTKKVCATTIFTRTSLFLDKDR